MIETPFQRRNFLAAKETLTESELDELKYLTELLLPTEQILTSEQQERQKQLAREILKA